MSRRLLFAGIAVTLALIFSVSIVAALFWGKRAVVWQVYRSERDYWRRRLNVWRATPTGP